MGVFTLMNDNSSNNDAPSELGSFTVMHESLLRADNHTITEVRPIGTKGASLGFRVVLSGMQSEEENFRQTKKDKIRSRIPSHDPFAETMTAPAFARDSAKQSIRVTALRGRGFSVNARNLLIGTANDIQDVYCCIRLLKSSQKEQQSNSPCWRTSTINDDTMPQWNESEGFVTTDTARDFVRVDAYNACRGREDQYLGSAEYPLSKLLRKRLMEMELKMETKPTGAFITLKSVVVSAVPESAPSLTDVVLRSSKRVSFDDSIDSNKSFRRKMSSIPRISKNALKRTLSVPARMNKKE